MVELANNVTLWPEQAMENYLWLDECLQRQPTTEKEFQPAWQADKYLLRGRMYAYIGVNDQNKRPIITLKLEPPYSGMLRREYADIVPGYYMNKVHWSSVYLDGEVPQEVISEMVCVSYKTMLSSLSKKAQKEIQDELNGTK